MRVLIVGDVGGHLSALEEVLGRFGVSVRGGEIPPGTVVLQVGDLVGRSAESEATVAAVERIRRSQPDRWVQLAGNHELHHLGGHQFAGTDDLSEEAVATMREWLASGWLGVAAAIETSGSGVLVSHAGLTRGLWCELGSPASAVDAAAALQMAWRDVDGWDVVNRPGYLLSGGGSPAPDSSAGPLWAEASLELVPPWLDHDDLPFDQVHGHTSVYDWNRAAFGAAGLVQHASVDRHKRHVVVRAGTHAITGIDPGLGRHGHTFWEPLIVEATRGTPL